MDRARVTAITSALNAELGEERRRLAKDLHDIVGHSLTVISLHARTADKDQALQRLASIDEVAQQAIRQMGRIVHALRARAVAAGKDPTGVVEAVKQAIDEIRDLAPPIRLRVLGPDVCPPVGVRRLVRQVVREAVINGMKHGRLQEVCVELFVDDEIDLRVYTRGGDDVANRRGFEGFGLGLVGLAEQAYNYGGALNVERSVGGRFAVVVRIPLVWNSVAPTEHVNAAAVELQAPAA